MKSILTTLLLIFSVGIFSQEISSKIKYILKNDDAKSLKNLITKENKNNCFSINNSNYTLLSLTIKYNAKACFKTLLGKKINLNKICTGKTPLMYAAKYQRLEMAKMLIKNKADATISYKGRTALDYAKKYKSKNIYTFLKEL